MIGGYSMDGTYYIIMNKTGMTLQQVLSLKQSEINFIMKHI